MDLTVVITGATSGIGRAVAREFVERGAFVAICGRDAGNVEETVGELEALAAATETGESDSNPNDVDPSSAADEGETAGSETEEAGSETEGAESETEVAGSETHAAGVWGMRADVRDEFDVERFMEGAAREAGPIDVVLANAAIAHGAPGSMSMAEEPYASFDDTIRTNARGVFATITEALPHLAEDARILVPSGAVAREGRSGMGAYAVSKAAAEAVARGFAADVEPAVGVVDPGIVHTDLTGKERARDPASVAPLFVWAATAAPEGELDGGRLDLRAWKDATR